VPKFQMLECMVALAGDEGNIVHRSQDTPVTYPELLVLQYVHGDDAVSDVHMLGEEERDNGSELDRLRRTYNAAAVKDVFPGASPRLPTNDRRFKPRQAPTPPKRNIAPSRNDPAPQEHDIDPPPGDLPVDGLAVGEG
jgi:hypothetical protein